MFTNENMDMAPLVKLEHGCYECDCDDRCSPTTNECDCTGDGSCGRVHVTSSDGSGEQFKHRWLHCWVSAQSSNGGRRRIWSHKAPAHGKCISDMVSGMVKAAFDRANNASRDGSLFAINSVEQIKAHMDKQLPSDLSKPTDIYCAKFGNQVLFNIHYHITPKNAVDHAKTKRTLVLPASSSHGGNGVARRRDRHDHHRRP